MGNKVKWHEWPSGLFYVTISPYKVIGILIDILTHWGRVTHIFVSKLSIIGSDNGLSPGRRQAIIRINAGILLIRPLGTNFNEILIEIRTFSFKKMHLKMSSGKWRPSCLCINVLTHLVLTPEYSGRISSVSWLLMPWFLMSPGHQRPWYWLFKIGSPAFSRGRTSGTCAILVLRNGKKCNYHKISNIRRTKSQNLNVSHLFLQLSLRNILKPSIMWRMKM